MCAPAETGKTTTLLDFMDTTVVPTVWYEVKKSGKDPELVVRGLLRELGSGAPEEPCDDLLSGWQMLSALPVLLHALEERAHANGGRLILLLDDYHRAAGSEDLNDLISGLLDLLPPGIYLIISPLYLMPSPLD